MRSNAADVVAGGLCVVPAGQRPSPREPARLDRGSPRAARPGARIDPEFADAYAAKATHYHRCSSTPCSRRPSRPKIARISSVWSAKRRAGARARSRERDGPVGAQRHQPVSWRWANYAETLDPAEERALSTAGCGPSWMGNHATALRIAERNVALGPNDAGVHMVLGIVQAYAGTTWRRSQPEPLARARACEYARSRVARLRRDRAWQRCGGPRRAAASRAHARRQPPDRFPSGARLRVFTPRARDDVVRIFAEIEARAAAAMSASVRGPWRTSPAATRPRPCAGSRQRLRRRVTMSPIRATCT